LERSLQSNVLGDKDPESNKRTKETTGRLDLDHGETDKEDRDTVSGIDEKNGSEADEEGREVLKASRYRLSGTSTVGKVDVKSGQQPKGESEKQEAGKTNDQSQAFAHVQLTTTGAEQLISVAEPSTPVPDEEYRRRQKGGELLQRCAFGAESLHVARLEDTDRDTGRSMIGLRLKQEDKSIALVFAPKESCLLLLGARKDPPQVRTYEKKVNLRLLIGSNGEPPISEWLWEEIQSLETESERHEEVEKRLKQWKAYLQVQEREAEKQQFTLVYQSVRHLERTGRVRLDLVNGSTDDERSRLGHSRRNRVFLFEEKPTEDDYPSKIAQAEVVHYDKQRHCLIVDLSNDDIERLEKDLLRIPPEGWVQHKAVGSLSMIHRQERAINTLKQTGGAMEDLDLFLFGSDEEIAPPEFGPVAPIPESACLDPEHTNEAQRLAVANALECPDMFFLQGPPGTGKTTFIAELCYQLGRRGKRALVASQANLAVDNALGRLQESRDILAVRVAPEDRVDEEGKPFVGENAVRTWLRGVAGHARSRNEARTSRLRAIEVATNSETLLRDWIHQSPKIKDEIRALEQKREQYLEEAEEHRQRSDLQEEKASRVRQVATSLHPDRLFDRASEDDELKVSAEIRQEWTALDSSILNVWEQNTERARRLVEEDVRDPWGLTTALRRLDARLKPGNEIASLVEESKAAKRRVDPLRKTIRNQVDSLRKAEKRLSFAEEEFKRQREELASLKRAANERRSGAVSEGSLDAERIPEEYSTWRASAERLAKARSLQAGVRSREGQTPDRSARKLARSWAQAEVANRTSIAKHLLRQLHLAVTRERELAKIWGIGWLFKYWLSRTLDVLEEAIQKVEKCIRGDSSSALGDAINEEIRERKEILQHNVSQAQKKVGECENQIEEKKATLKELGREAAVATDRLQSRFGSLLSEEDHAGKTPAERFISISNALSELPDRLNQLRREVRESRENVQHVARKVRTDALRKAEEKETEAWEAMDKACRRTKEAKSLRQDTQELYEQHSEAREVWEQICVTDPTIPEEEEAHRTPSIEWLDNYVELIDEVNSDRVRAEKAIVDDWEEALQRGNEAISGKLKERFYRNANVVGATCARVGKQDFRNEYGIFDVVIVDEVSKATPTELLMPSLLGSKVALVGDHRQLAPVFGRQSNFEAAADELDMSEENLRENLRRSLFKERFEYFSEIEESREQETTASEDDTEARHGRRTLMLTKQYRMHSQIMEGINQFYDDQLELGHISQNGEKTPLDDLRQHGLDIEPWVYPGCHLVWVNTPVGREWEHTQEGPTRYNQKELETTTEMLRGLADRFRENEELDLSVGVTSVYAAQVDRIRQEVRKLSLPERMKRELKISSVDRFQGMERDVMFLNLVLNQKDKPPSKWLRTPERINVAMSRARRLLVIVGSKHNYVEVERTSPAYRRFFDVAKRYGHYVRANHIIS